MLLKKMIPLLLVCALVFGCSTIASATEIPSSQLNNVDPQVLPFTLEDIQMAPLCSDETTYSLFATRYFSIDNLAPNNIYSDFVEYEVQQGEDVYLNVDCTWYPHTSSIDVGIYRVDVADPHGRPAYGGSYEDELIFGDMDAGTYIVYVRNTGTRTITDGSIRYSIS